MSELIPGRLYKLASNNLGRGVYNGDGGFTGIRVKFGNSSLDTELHFDANDAHGTVCAAEDTGIDIPEGIAPTETIPEGRYKINQALLDWLKVQT